MNHILLMEGEMIRVMAYCTEVGNDSNHIRKEEENPFKGLWLQKWDISQCIGTSTYSGTCQSD